MQLELLKERLKLFVELPPVVVAKKMKRKLTQPPADKFLLEDIVDKYAPAKHLKPQRMVNFLMRTEKIVQRHQADWCLDFEGKRVLEIGGGPVLGFAPIAVFLGCEKYVLVEPFHNPEIIKHKKVRKYFEAVHSDLTSLYGQRMSREEFMQALDKKVEVFNKEIEKFVVGSKFDISLSQSVLEHVQDADAAVNKLAEVMAPGASFMHLVNFGNHRGTNDPFQDMYTQSREAYHENFGKLINLLRVNDVERLFEKHQLSALSLPYVVRDSLEAKPSQSWSDRYTLNDLLTRVVIFVNKFSE